jgi:hypothetical protein
LVELVTDVGSTCIRSRRAAHVDVSGSGDDDVCEVLATLAQNPKLTDIFNDDGQYCNNFMIRSLSTFSV